jgi:hypothetical protein
MRRYKAVLDNIIKSVIESTLIWLAFRSGCGGTGAEDCFFHIGLKHRFLKLSVSSVSFVDSSRLAASADIYIVQITAKLMTKFTE